MPTSQRLLLLLLGFCVVLLQPVPSNQQVNLALKGTATQSSVHNNDFASFANDGNRGNNMSFIKCAHTNYDISPWWRVDLLAVYDIGSVIITNRGDCCAERINGAEIHIGNSSINNGNDNPRCIHISSIPAGTSAKYTCKMIGRYVNIIIPNISQYLTLCEVEVYGVPVVMKRTFLRIKFNTSEDLTNPMVRDNVLQKIKSTNVQSSAFKIRWTKEPEMEN